MKITPRAVKLTLALTALGFVTGLIACLFLSLRIGVEVRAMSQTAIQRHPGDPLAALMQCVEDTNLSLRERNRAVWTLGQLGDRRALAFLRKHYSGDSCDHANALCQAELLKAIKLLEGGANASAWVWLRLPRSYDSRLPAVQ